MGLTANTFAEATKEIYSDFGLYSGNPEGTFRMNFFPFQENSNYNANAVFADPTAPEGKTVVRFEIPRSWGGFSLSNVDTANPSTVVPRDYSGYQTGHLRFWLKSDRQLKIEIVYGPAAIRRAVFRESTNNQWVEQIIPLSNFGTVDYTQIREPFIISHAGGGAYPAVWSVDHVRWTKPLASIQIFPSATNVAAGRHRLYTAEGRDSSNEFVIIYPNWTVTSNGTVAPGKAQATVLTKGASGNGTVTATDGSISDTSTFAHVALTNEIFGIVSETLAGLTLDTDSRVVAFQGGGASAIVLADDTVGAPEGTKSLRATVNQPTAGFSGWAVQWGLGADQFTPTRDMSQFYDGSIRFWFKGPSAIQNVTYVGVRSGNIAAGKEVSKVQLRNYTTFDNQWRAVVIPMTEFARARPFADISRTKIFFNISVEGSSSGQQMFWVDNVRWDTQSAGALASVSVQPASVTMPPNSRRVFYARGADAAGNAIDVYPTWTTTGGIGTLSATSGPTVILTAVGSNASGAVRATVSGLPVGVSNVTVQPIISNQSFNVYSDAGAGGFVGVSEGPAGSATDLTLAEQPTGGVEGQKFMRATYTLRNTPGLQDAFAVWFVEQENFSRFMRAYESGYLRFNVRTTRDLEVSIRSENIPPGSNTAKFRLSELGIPLDGNWQEVVIPLADFKARTSAPNLLNFDQVKTFFAIAALSSMGGEATNATFDIDNVKWLTTVAGGPDKVYQGLVERQNATTGLLPSYLSLPQAVTYDQALAAMAFTYRRDFAKAEAIFTFYRNLGVANLGFREEYNAATGAIMDQDRFVGPNAWMLLALIHHRAVTGSTTNDAMIDQLANWIRGFQDTDGGVRFGAPGAGSTMDPLTKATEFNLDCYTAFKAYGRLRNNATFTMASQRVLNWLATRVWNSGQGRFNLGIETVRGVNTDKALDAYSWAVLAVNQSTHSVLTPQAIEGLLSRAETDFRNQKVNDLTGNLIDGFDFSSMPLNPNVDKDAVWLEGTAHMAVAFRAFSNATKADFYINEIEKAIVDTSPTGQGIPYATNMGTAYGFNMDSLNPAVSAAAWYLFAKDNFNPMQPLPMYTMNVRNVSNNQPTPEITWNVTAPVSGWVRANQYIEFGYQAVDIAAWGVQIYTDNKNASLQTPIYEDPTPLVTNDLDSDPSGLILVTGGATSSDKLPMAWSIKENVTDLPAVANPNHTGTNGCPDDANSYQWFFMKDKATPETSAPVCNNTSVTNSAFSNGEDYVRMAKGSGTTRTAHFSQGPSGYFPSLAPDFVFFQAEFTNSAPTDNFVTQIVFEFFHE